MKTCILWSDLVNVIIIQGLQGTNSMLSTLETTQIQYRRTLLVKACNLVGAAGTTADGSHQSTVNVLIWGCLSNSHKQ